MDLQHGTMARHGARGSPTFGRSKFRPFLKPPRPRGSSRGRSLGLKPPLGRIMGITSTFGTDVGEVAALAQGCARKHPREVFKRYLLTGNTKGAIMFM